MKHYLLFIALMVCVWSTSALATKPCTPLSQEEFKQRIASSELIIRGEITSHSKERSHNSWTTLKVLEVLQGQYKQDKVKVVGWTSVSRPMFYYPRGRKMILLLAPAENKNKNDMVMKYMSWSECIPSLMPKTPDMNQYSVNMSTMTLEDFKQVYLK